MYPQSMFWAYYTFSSFIVVKKCITLYRNVVNVTVTQKQRKDSCVKNDQLQLFFYCSVNLYL